MNGEIPQAAPLATVLINNHNYARFLGEAIDSALAQDYPDIEVVVVDDASTDGSRDVISGYGARIRSVMLETNVGQTGAVTAGIAASRGDVVLMLDADDICLPHRVSRIMALRRQQPDAVMYVHQLPDASPDLARVASPRPLGSLGDLRRFVRRMHGYWAWPPTSGQAFTRDLLDRLSPLPPTRSMCDVDGVLAPLAPLFGDIAGIEEPLGLRRLHGNNMYSHDARRALQAWTIREEHRRLDDMLAAGNEVLERLGEPYRFNVRKHPWHIEVAFQLGEASAWQVAASRLRLWRWRSPRQLRREVSHTLRRCRRVRRALAKQDAAGTGAGPDAGR